jgi:hypothetical protein
MTLTFAANASRLPTVMIGEVNFPINRPAVAATPANVESPLQSGI